MKGSMRQRDSGSWELRVYAGVDPISGRKKYVQRTVTGNKRAAQRELARLVAEVDRGQAVATDATVSDLLDRWWSTASPDWSAATRRQNESAIRNHVRPSLGPMRLDKLTAADLDRWYADLRKKPGRRSATLAPATIVRIAGVVRSALTQAVKWGWIPVNPSQASTLPKVYRGELKPPDVEAMVKILRRVQAEELPLYTFLKVASTTGPRRSQLCGLRWSDIDFDGSRITFARAVVDGDNGIEVKGTKTDQIYRVAVDGDTLKVLGDHREASMSLAETCGEQLRAESFVFSYEVDGSKPWRPDGVSHRWIRYRRQVGLDDVRLHDVRHFMATTMLTAGVPVSVVAGRLSHARSATTLNVYSHFVDAGDQDAADLLGELMNNAEAGRDDRQEMGTYPRLQEGPDPDQGSQRADEET